MIKVISAIFVGLVSLLGIASGCFIMLVILEALESALGVHAVIIWGFICLWAASSYVSYVALK